ncbi:MAG TPA: hypothetical protein VGN00_14190 [Puia sp.]|jgi:hypothetical protein
MNKSKLLCIIDGTWEEEIRVLGGFVKYWKDSTGPAYGDIVAKTGSFHEGGDLYYFLEEWPPKDDTDGYSADCFIPIEEESETAEFAIERENKTI